MDGHLGDLECVAPDRSLPQAHRCSCSSEPTVHVFFIALCTHRQSIFSNVTYAFDTFQVSGVPPLEVRKPLFAFSSEI